MIHLTVDWKHVGTSEKQLFLYQQVKQETPHIHIHWLRVMLERIAGTLPCPPKLSADTIPIAGDPVSLLGIRAAGAAQLHHTDGHAGETAQAEPATVPPGSLLEVC